MAWFADLAGKAESLLNNLDEQTGAALRSNNVLKSKKLDRNDALNPDPIWGQKKRPIPKSLKKITPVTETRSTYIPSRKPSPISHHQPRSLIKDNKDVSKDKLPRTKKSPVKKSHLQYSLNNCPNTLISDIGEHDIIIDQFGLKQRRFSLPADLEMINNDGWTYKMQNLEVENAMLKNELNVMNREVSDLLERLRKNEDGNKVVNGCEELSKTYNKVNNAELLNHRINLDNETLTSQLEELKRRIQDINSIDVVKYKEKIQDMEMEIGILRNRNMELEDKAKELSEKGNEKDSTQMKLENELRHAQSTIGDLQNNLEKSTAECHRLEKDWEAYKLRVKSMLFAKDNEIKSLQEGMNLTEDTKVLMEQLENLKEERDDLSEAISRVRGECSGMKQYVEQLESRHNAAERVVGALRDALKEERASRNRAETQCITIGKELKNFQIESGQTISSLRTALRDKENELNHLRDTTSSCVRTTDTSALNVADYDVMQGTIDNEKIQYLTHTLVQRQGKIESLLADNNMLKIQLEKLESKYKTEVTALRANYSHSVVHLQDGDCRSRSRASESTLTALLLRMAIMIKRYPLFRIFIIIYMIGLHLWVLTVLLTSTPDDYTLRPTKS